MHQPMKREVEVLLPIEFLEDVDEESAEQPQSDGIEIIKLDD